MGGLFFDVEAIAVTASCPAQVPRGVVKRTVSVRDRDDAARRRRNKKQRRAFEEDTYALPPGTSNATARAQANTPKRPLHGQPGPACIPQKGFMDTGWLHRDDAALAVAWTEYSSTPRWPRKAPRSWLC